ncbi:hypothetical protein [Rhodococcus sp. ABRD24]|uniref:hypothetical protein n=1 Tax=Rhodococcus sp. ABRD24 TaxID=2507582 RepID=UPI0013F15885|nr:hypothetical protein [Rhodococcus sp. ABRD24]
MATKVLNRGSAGLVVAAVAMLAAPGMSYASTTVTPPDTPVVVTSSELRMYTPGYTLRCTDVSGYGMIPAAPANSSPSPGGIAIDISSMNLSSCALNVQPVSVVASGIWRLMVDHDGAYPRGFLIIPAGGAVVTVPPIGCSITLGTSTIGPLPYTKPSVIASNTGTVNFNSTGGVGCPPAGSGTATLNGKLRFSPGIDILP